MRVLQDKDLDAGGLRPAFERTLAHLEAGDFRAADVKKLNPGPYYRAKLSDADRLIFRFGDWRGETCLLVLEIVRNHAYETSRFLRGAAVDESKLTPVERPAPDRYRTAGVVKDMAAGAVLVFSIGCAACGVVLFWDVAVFRRMLAFFAARPLLALLLAASLAVAWRFIFGKRKEGK